MKLDIVIPSKDRRQKLDSCLNSLFLSLNGVGEEDSVSIHLYLSIIEEYTFYSRVFRNIDEVKVNLLESYRVPDFWNSHLNNMNADAMCYLNDDVLLFRDTLPTLFKEYKLKFPDFDGIMGINQSNLPEDHAVEGAFGVIGKNYISIFPEGKVWCPDYDRLRADYELWQYARYIGKFYFSRITQIEHLHPAFSGKEDDTHRDVRKYKAKDNSTFNLRQKRSLLWGKTFELITRGE